MGNTPWISERGTCRKLNNITTTRLTSKPGQLFSLIFSLAVWPARFLNIYNGLYDWFERTKAEKTTRNLLRSTAQKHPIAFERYFHHEIMGWIVL